MKLSIIIVNYNTRELLQTCLQSIFSQTQNIDFEAIVVDNGSTDGSREMLAQSFPQVATIFNNENRGFAAANNQGVRQAKGEYILLLNSDTEIRDDAITKTVAFMDAHPEAGIAGCRLLNSDGSLQRSCEYFPELRDYFFESFYFDRIFPNSKIVGRFHLTWFDYNRTEKVDHVMGAFLMIRKKTIDQIGLMDENFFFYAEEADWCYRAKQAGWQTYFFPGAEAVHHGGGSADSISPKMLVQLHESRFKFYRKYHRPPAALAAKIILAMGSIMRIFLWGFLAIFYIFQNRQNAKKSMKKCLAFLAVLGWYLGVVKSIGQKRIQRMCKNKQNV